VSNTPVSNNVRLDFHVTRIAFITHSSYLGLAPLTSSDDTWPMTAVDSALSLSRSRPFDLRFDADGPLPRSMALGLTIS